MKKNNYMFKGLFFVLLLMVPAITAHSQGTIQTPMGQTINVENGYDDIYWLSLWEAQGVALVSNNGWNAVRIGAATSNYNCHSYAWNVAEGGSSTNTWIDQTYNGNPNLSKYWSNDGYIETSSPQNGRKVFYPSGDHSAVCTNTLTVVQSKWGSLPLYKHSVGDCPYDTGDLHYYKLTNPTISGSSNLLCNSSQGNYSESAFTNMPLSYIWSTSSPLTQVSGNYGSSYTVSGTSQNGLGTINLTITSPSGLVSNSTKEIWVGAPIITSISGSTHVDAYGMAIYEALSPGDPQATYTWSVSPSGTVYNYGKTAQIYFQGDGDYHVYATATNSCGTSSTTELFVGVGSYETDMIFPNPGDDNVTLKVVDTVGSFESKSSFETYDIQIWSESGNLVKSLKTNSKEQNITTKDLPNGKYFVNITRNGKTTRQQLLIKH